ncbi:MAG: hypothetical protein ABIN36_09530 [Ferruginibacter sp.]
MKTLKSVFLGFTLLFTVIISRGQNIELTSGDFEKLRAEKTINLEFNWDKFGVGDYAKEAQWIKYKVNDLNSKEAGSGDKWLQEWNDAKLGRYAPKFMELFTKYSDITFDSTAKYTLIFKTSFLEPGFQVAVKAKPGQVEGQIWLVETTNKTKKIAVVMVERREGKGAHFDWATRIAEAYGSTGKNLALLIKKDLNKKKDN